MGSINNNQPVTKILANGVYVVKDGDTQWGGEVNRNFEILSELNRRAKLYVTYGDVEEDTMPVKNWSYSIDGNDVIIQLPKQSVPKVDHFKLTIKMDGNTMGIFDNTQDQTIDIYSPTYAELVFKQNGNILQTYRPDGNSVDIVIPEVTNHILTITHGNQVLGTFNNTADTTINIPTLVNNKTLTIIQNGQILGTFDNSSNTTITLPATPSYQFVPKTLTITQNGQTLGNFVTDNDATIDIPSTTVDNKTLTITQNGQILGSFNNSNNVTINIPASSVNQTPSFVPKTLTLTQDGQTLGNFVTDNDGIIDIPAYPDGSLTITVNGTSVGTFNIKSNATIDIPVSSFNGASHTIERYNGSEDSQGVKQFDLLQTLNTANTESIKTYDLVLDIDGNLVNYNPFVDDNYNIFINTNSGNPYGSSNDYNEIANYITFSPYPPTRDQTFYIKDFMGNSNSDNMVIELPVHYIDIWNDYPTDSNGNPNPNATKLGHFHTYGENGNDVILNLSSYMKVADMPTKISEFSNDMNYVTSSDLSTILQSYNGNTGSGNTGSGNTGNFITQAYADSKYITLTTADNRYAKPSDIPENLSDLHNDMTVSNFTNDALYITEAIANNKYLTIVDAEQTYLKINDLPTDLSQFNNDLDLGDFTNNAGYIKEADADTKYIMTANMPTALSQFNNDLALSQFNNDLALSTFSKDLTVSDFVNDANYISESKADGKYVPLSSVNVPNGVAGLNADGHLVLPSGIEIW